MGGQNTRITPEQSKMLNDIANQNRWFIAE